MKIRKWIAFSGFVWFVMGLFLLYKGLHFIADGVFQSNSFCKRFSSPERAATLLIAAGLLLGFFKGRFVLSKTVRRVVLRIISLPEPIRLKYVYSPAYYFLILG